jgi:3-(3-hydroxy-phenyl)propionate hydroxylase
MGIELDDLGSHERWLVVDVILKRDRPDLGDRSIQFCDPARPSTYVCGVGRRRRWELMLLPGEDAETMTRPEQIWSLLRRWITTDDAELERPASYTFHSVVAQGWRRGRLLIAGDAAHQTPPFMGQGLCAGIRDASNLAWKLADVIDGTASESLLDSYESERSPHVREFIETTLGLGRIIQETDPQAARRRDALLLAKPLTLTAPRPRLGPGDHDGGESSGRIAEQPWLADGSRLDDRIGYRHALLIEPALASQVTLPSDGSLAVLPGLDAGCREWLARLGARAILIRPDRYLAGTAANATELAGLLARHHRARA